MCTGNICRSPAAEAVFRNLVSKRGLDSKFHIDSAGTIGYHEVIPCIYLTHYTITQFGNAITDEVFCEFRVTRQTRGWDLLQRSGGLRWPQYPDLSNPQISVTSILSLQWTGRTMVLSQALLLVFQYLWIFFMCASWCISFKQYAEDILNSFERWRHKEPLPDSAPNKVSA